MGLAIVIMTTEVFTSLHTQKNVGMITDFQSNMATSLTGIKKIWGVDILI